MNEIKIKTGFPEKIKGIVRERTKAERRTQVNDFNIKHILKKNQSKHIESIFLLV